MNNDVHARVQALVGGIVDAAERHGVGAAGLDIPELNAAAVRGRLDAFSIAGGHTGDIAVAQVVRGAGATHCHTYCDRRDNGGPRPFNIFSVRYASWSRVTGSDVRYLSDTGNRSPVTSILLNSLKTFRNGFIPGPQSQPCEDRHGIGLPRHAGFWNGGEFGKTAASLSKQFAASADRRFIYSTRQRQNDMNRPE